MVYHQFRNGETDSHIADVGLGFWDIEVDRGEIPADVQDIPWNPAEAAVTPRFTGAICRLVPEIADRENAIGPKNLALDEDELTEEELDEACGEHEGIDESGRPCNIELQYEEIEEERQCNECRDCMMCGLLTEAK